MEAVKAAAEKVTVVVEKGGANLVAEREVRVVERMRVLLLLPRSEGKRSVVESLRNPFGLKPLVACRRIHLERTPRTASTRAVIRPLETVALGTKW